MRISYASGRQQLCALTLNTVAGSLPEATYYFYLVGRNDCGFNLPGPAASQTVDGSQGIELTLPSAAYIEGENWLEYAVLVNTVDNPATSKVLFSWVRSDLTLPYVVNLTVPVHVQTERQLAAFPTTNLLNGLLVTRTTDGLIYRYNSFSNQWQRFYDSYNIGIITTTTDDLFGCDTPISLLDESRYIINSDYAMDGSQGVAKRYWLFNDQATVFPQGREIGLTTTVQDTDLSSLFYNLFQVVFEGYFDQTAEEFITLRDSVSQFSYLNIEIPYSSSMENLILERDLLTNQAFQFSVFPEFDLSELGLGLNLLPVDSSINIIPFLVPNVGKVTDLGELLGDVIIGNDPNLRRVYPTTGLSAFVDSGISVIEGRIARVRNATSALGLSQNEANQILAINSSGNVYAVESLRINERQRALVSTQSGESLASAFSSQIEGNSNPNVTIDVIYPEEIRGNYPDVIAGSNKGVFNAEEIVVYVRKRNSSGGAVAETRRFGGFSPTNTISDEISFLYENGTIYSDTIPNTEFGLWRPANLTPIDIQVQNTTGTFFFDFAITFKYNGNTITGINHSVDSGSIYELTSNLAQLGEANANSLYWKAPVANKEALTNISSSILFNTAVYPVISGTDELPSLYMYLSESEGIVNNDTYLNVSNGTGRFVKLSGTNTSSEITGAVLTESGDIFTTESGSTLTLESEI